MLVLSFTSNFASLVRFKSFVHNLISASSLRRARFLVSSYIQRWEIRGHTHFDLLTLFHDLPDVRESWNALCLASEFPSLNDWWFSHIVFDNNCFIIFDTFSYMYSLICMLDDKGDGFNHVYTNVETTYKFKPFLWIVNTVVPSWAEDEQVGSVLLWKDLHNERHDLQRVWILDRWL